MRVGHINLATSINGIGEHFVKLIEALDRQGIEQHVLVRNNALARRVAVYESVVAGPVVRVPVMAYCLMPRVAVVHLHDDRSAPAGLLFTLTRSIPYVLTRRTARRPANPLGRAMLARAAGVICPSARVAQRLSRTGATLPVVDVVADISHRNPDNPRQHNRIAAEHLRIYRRAVDSWRVPALLL